MPSILEPSRSDDVQRHGTYRWGDDSGAPLLPRGAIGPYCPPKGPIGSPLGLQHSKEDLTFFKEGFHIFGMKRSIVEYKLGIIETWIKDILSPLVNT